MDGSRIRKEKVADSKISGYVWTGPKLCLARLKEINLDAAKITKHDIVQSRFRLTT